VGICRFVKKKLANPNKNNNLLSLQMPFLMNKKPCAGKILIAEPFLGDQNFERSVVLLCEHKPSGAFGLILNQATQSVLSDLIHDIYTEFPVYIGGPVEQNTLHYIHRLGELIEESVDLGNGLWWSGDFEQVKSLINIGKIEKEDIRFFLGYSGWGAGQIENELDQNTWIVSDIMADQVFESGDSQFWRTALRRMGGDFKVLANYPIDPRLN
jgi:putative transcriptional regulator